MSINLNSMNSGRFRLPLFSLSITALASLLYVYLGAAAETLVWSRTDISDGEVWRLLTGHLIHSDVNHALWDILAFFIIGTMLEQYSRKSMLIAIVTSLILINSWLWWGLTDLLYYCGLSGIINTMMGLLLYQLWRQQPQPIILLISGLYIAKVLIENSMGQAMFTDTLWPALPSVHLVALISVVLLILLKSVGAKLKCLLFQLRVRH